MKIDGIPAPAPAPAPSPEAAAANRLTTRFTLAFAVVSAAFSTLPLFAASWWPGAPRVFDRGAALAWYLPALCFFFGLAAPGELLRAPGRTLRPFAVLFVYAGVFAALPAVVAAYVSGVAASDLFAAAAAPTLVAGVPLLARAAGGAALVRASVVLFLVAAVVLPGVALGAHAAGVGGVAERALDWSPTAYAWRLASRRPTGASAAAWWGLAAAVWGALPFVARRRGARATAAALLLGAAAAATASFAAPQDAPRAGADPLAAVRLEAPYGPRTRPGARTPLRVRMPTTGGAVEFRFRTERRRLPADGGAYDLAPVLAPDEQDVLVVAGDAAKRVALPTTSARPDDALVLVRGEAGGGAARLFAAARPGLFVVPAPTSFRAVDAEAFDAAAIDRALYDALPATERAEWDRFAALGGALMLVDPAATAESAVATADGEGRRLVVSDPSVLEPRALLRRPVDYFDPSLRSVFLRPDWARVDLGPLALFLVLYHLSFFAAFLLPWRLDAKKSSGVYLASTGFVLIAVVLGGRAVLRSFFLRDNQTATQAFTAATIEARPEGGRAVLRQWRSYASMSGERRDLVAGGADTALYRAPDAAPYAVSVVGAALKLEGLELDRFQKNVLVREDRVLPAPLRLDLRSDGAGAEVATVRPTEVAEDPAGLRWAEFSGAWLLEPDGRTRYAAPDAAGRFRFADDLLGPPPPPEVRAAVARGTPPDRAAGGGPRRLVVVGRGAARLDRTEGYFLVEDRGFCLVFLVSDRG